MSQEVPLNDQIETLEHLQELDLQIDRLKKNKSSLPSSLRTLDDSLGKLKQAFEAKKNAVAEIEKVQKQTRAALDLNAERLARSAARLESVQNSQEFQAINKEIDQLKKLNTNLEEQSKKSLAEIEAIQKEIAVITTDLEKQQTDRDVQANQLSSQASQFETEIAALMKERAALTSRINPKILGQYDRIRSARSGLGIVPAVGGRCKGCNMMVPPQLYNQIQRLTEVHTCPSCHRILFIPTASPPASVG